MAACSTQKRALKKAVKSICVSSLSSACILPLRYPMYFCSGLLLIVPFFFLSQKILIPRYLFESDIVMQQISLTPCMSFLSVMICVFETFSLRPSFSRMAKALSAATASFWLSVSISMSSAKARSCLLFTRFLSISLFSIRASRYTLNRSGPNTLPYWILFVGVNVLSPIVAFILV